MKESDTPRGAGGLMSWTASKAVGHWFRRRAQARLCQQFRTTRVLHPRCLVADVLADLLQLKPNRGHGIAASPEMLAAEVPFLAAQAGHRNSTLPFQKPD